MDVDPVLALLAIAGVAEAARDAEPDLVWSLYTFDDRMTSVIFSLAPLRRVSDYGERIEEGGMFKGRSEYLEDFASRGMSKSYAR